MSTNNERRRAANDERRRAATDDERRRAANDERRRAATDDERRRAARERIRTARRAAADVLSARREELRRDLERRMREMAADREAYHAA